jgi:hypothetical protein
MAWTRLVRRGWLEDGARGVDWELTGSGRQKARREGVDAQTGGGRRHGLSIAFGPAEWRGPRGGLPMTGALPWILGQVHHVLRRGGVRSASRAPSWVPGGPFGRRDRTSGADPGITGVGL